MEFKARVIAVIVLLVLAKLTNVAVPLVLKEIVDALSGTPATGGVADPGICL